MGLKCFGRLRHVVPDGASGEESGRCLRHPAMRIQGVNGSLSGGKVAGMAVDYLAQVPVEHWNFSTDQPAFDSMDERVVKSSRQDAAVQTVGKKGSCCKKRKGHGNGILASLLHCSIDQACLGSF